MFKKVKYVEKKIAFLFWKSTKFNTWKQPLICNWKNKIITDYLLINVNTLIGCPVKKYRNNFLGWNKHLVGWGQIRQGVKISQYYTITHQFQRNDEKIPFHARGNVWTRDCHEFIHDHNTLSAPLKAGYGSPEEATIFYAARGRRSIKKADSASQ